MWAGGAFFFLHRTINQGLLVINLDYKFSTLSLMCELIDDKKQLTGMCT